MPDRIENRFAELHKKKEREEQRRITHKDISDETGLAKATIGMYMRNQVQRTDLRVVAVLCNWLNIGVGDFFVLVRSNNGQKISDADTAMNAPDDDRLPIPA